MEDFKVGSVVVGVVTGIKDYGIFVKFDNGYSGLVHISEMSDRFVKDTKDYANIGEHIYVEIQKIDDVNKKCILSIKNINYRLEMPRLMKETVRGFGPLKEHLPIWIDEKIKELDSNNNN